MISNSSSNAGAGISGLLDGNEREDIGMNTSWDELEIDEPPEMGNLIDYFEKEKQKKSVTSDEDQI